MGKGFTEGAFECLAMRIRKLSLTNFRNYRNQEFSPSGGISVLVGQNAQGKTAVLEAAYFIATSKSHRTSKDAELIRVGEDFCRVAADVEREERSDVLLEVNISRKEKKIIKINRTKHNKIADLVGQLNAVIFSSYDIDMVKGDPSARRRFMNLEISQIHPQYIYSYGRYKRVLEHRNGLLRSYKTRRADLIELSTLDDQLVQYGAAILEKRHLFAKRLSELAGPIYTQLTEGQETLQVEYVPSFDLGESSVVKDIRNRFIEVIEAGRTQELARGVSLWGPQRDDVRFTVDGLDAKNFGSEGQQRSVALAAKLAEVALVEEMTGEAPVVLLDDVNAELDEKRRSHVFDFTCGRCQTFVTVTELPGLPDDIVRSAEIFDVTGGEVKPR